MTLNNWSASLAGLAPALGNHLWQSTMFLAAAALLTMSLRKNTARVRYWLWLAASVKFLIPFSLLITVGSHLWHGAAQTNAGFYHAIDAVGQPFLLPLIPETSGAYAATVLPRATPLVPILFAAWLSGLLVILSVWFARWRRISATVRKTVPLREGREVEVLRRMMAVGGVRKRIEILLACASLEPGIFGIARPVLLWPEGLSERLDDAHLEAILAHELWHVQRRDNLAAAVHMLVEAVFWFHPLLWWLGARLVEERERACDEEVLEKVHALETASVLEAVSEQLGLELKVQTVPLEVLVIDHAEKIASASSQTQKQTQSLERVKAANGPTNREGSLTCVFTGVKYPEGTVVVQGDGLEHLCARVLDPGKANENGQPLYTEEWVRSNPAIRERSTKVLHPPAAPPAVCTPKPSTQSDLCSCTESGSWSENAVVNSTNGGKLNCKKGKWVPLVAGQAKQLTSEKQVVAARVN